MPDGQLVVRAPMRMPLHLVEHFVQKKSDWILRKQELSRRRIPEPKKFTDGEEFLFLGRLYPLRIYEDIPAAVVLEQDLRISRQVLENPVARIEDWYKTQAHTWIAERAGYFAAVTRLYFKSLRLSNAQSRWGSCSHQGALNFSWRLIMAPPRVVDYVIVHELMHLKHKNHSARFWEAVQAVLPEYKEDERWLKENGYRLVIA